MARVSRRGLRKPIILTALLAVAAPILSADTPNVGTIGVFVALIASLGWWATYFLRRRRARTQATAVTFCNRGLEAVEVGDFAGAMQWFTLSANAGNANAMNQIGLLYMNGSGVPADAKMAASWFQKAIAQGDVANAPINLRKLLAETEGQQYRGDADANGRMTRAAALEVFDLQEGASAADIRAAYLRLMQQVHPDHGGSTFLAKQVNEARNLLLTD